MWRSMIEIGLRPDLVDVGTSRYSASVLFGLR